MVTCETIAKRRQHKGKLNGVEYTIIYNRKSVVQAVKSKGRQVLLEKRDALSDKCGKYFITRETFSISSTS